MVGIALFARPVLARSPRRSSRSAITGRWAGTSTSTRASATRGSSQTRIRSTRSCASRSPCQRPDRAGVGHHALCRDDDDAPRPAVPEGSVRIRSIAANRTRAVVGFRRRCGPGVGGDGVDAVPRPARAHAVRGIFTKAFTPRRLEAMKGRIQQITEKRSSRRSEQ